MEYKDIKTPEELYDFIISNLTYGFIGRNGKKYLHDDPKWEEDWISQYYLQSPEELIKSKVGVCWDFSELARDWLKKQGFEVTSFIIVWKEGGPAENYPTHAFDVFVRDGKYCWSVMFFKEGADIETNDSLEGAKKTAKNYYMDMIKKYYNGTDEDVKQMLLVEVPKENQPKHGSSPIEYVKSSLKDMKTVDDSSADSLSGKRNK